MKKLGFGVASIILVGLCGYESHASLGSVIHNKQEQQKKEAAAAAVAGACDREMKAKLAAAERIIGELEVAVGVANIALAKDGANANVVRDAIIGAAVKKADVLTYVNAVRGAAGVAPVLVAAITDANLLAGLGNALASDITGAVVKKTDVKTYIDGLRVAGGLAALVNTNDILSANLTNGVHTLKTDITAKLGGIPPATVQAQLNLVHGQIGLAALPANTITALNFATKVGDINTRIAAIIKDANKFGADVYTAIGLVPWADVDYKPVTGVTTLFDAKIAAVTTELANVVKDGGAAGAHLSVVGKALKFGPLVRALRFSLDDVKTDVTVGPLGDWNAVKTSLNKASAIIN